MSRANKNLPEQHWVNTAHSYLQPIDLDTFAVKSDQTTPSLGKSEALASIQHQNDSQRINSQQTNHLSPKACTWSKQNGAYLPRICREGAFVFPFRFIKVDWLNKVFYIQLKWQKDAVKELAFQRNNLGYWRRLSTSRTSLTTQGASSWRTTSTWRKVSSNFGFRFVVQSREEFVICPNAGI